jgi:hypothetical protein
MVVRKINVKDIFVRKAGNSGYIAFRLSEGNKPTVIGLTIPLSKTQLKKEFGVIF